MYTKLIWLIPLGTDILNFQTLPKLKYSPLLMTLCILILSLKQLMPYNLSAADAVLHLFHLVPEECSSLVPEECSSLLLEECSSLVSEECFSILYHHVASLLLAPTFLCSMSPLHLSVSYLSAFFATTFTVALHNLFFAVPYLSEYACPSS